MNIRTYEIKAKVNGKLRKKKVNIQEDATFDDLNVVLLQEIKSMFSISINQVAKSINDDLKEAQFEVMSHIELECFIFSLEGILEAYDKHIKGYPVSKEAFSVISKKERWLKTLHKHYYG